ncbi:hypothetical protein [Bacteroides ihuae]|nr:hypothetical protein [Bacteroides ihuae]
MDMTNRLRHTGKRDLWTLALLMEEMGRSYQEKGGSRGIIP